MIFFGKHFVSFLTLTNGPTEDSQMKTLILIVCMLATGVAQANTLEFIENNGRLIPLHDAHILRIQDPEYLYAKYPHRTQRAIFDGSTVVEEKGKAPISFFWEERTLKEVVISLKDGTLTSKSTVTKKPALKWPIVGILFAAFGTSLIFGIKMLPPTSNYGFFICVFCMFVCAVGATISAGAISAESSFFSLTDIVSTIATILAAMTVFCIIFPPWPGNHSRLIAAAIPPAYCLLMLGLLF